MAGPARTSYRACADAAHPESGRPPAPAPEGGGPVSGRPDDVSRKIAKRNEQSEGPNGGKKTDGRGRPCR